MVRVLKYNEAKFKITQMIMQRELQPGDKLASERELAGELGMSVISVRRALAEFQDAGIVRKVSGVGTFYDGNLELDAYQVKVALVNIGDSLYPGSLAIREMEKVLRPYQGTHKVFHSRIEVQPEILAELRDFDKIMVTGFLTSSWIECLSSLGKPLLQIGESEFKSGLTRVVPDWRDAVANAFGCFPQVPLDRAGFLLPDPANSTYGVELRRLIEEHLRERGLKPRGDLLCHIPIDLAITRINEFIRREHRNFDILVVESGSLQPLMFALERQRLIPDMPLVVMHEELALPEDITTLPFLYQVVFEQFTLARATELFFTRPCDFFAGNQIESIKTRIIKPDNQL